MPRPKPKRRGIGAMCSIQKRVLHPSKKISEHEEYKLLQPSDKIPGWKIIGRDAKKKQSTRNISCVILRNELFREGLFYCAAQFAVVDVEGPSESFFPVVRRKRKQNPSSQTEVSTPNNAARSREGTETTPDSAAALPSDLRSIHARGIESGDAEDIARVRALGFDVDDDNEPAPENVPTEEVTTEAGLKDNQQWGTHPFDPRKASNAPNPLPSLEGLPKGERSKSVTLLW
eukprot:CAMPEP_0116052952 /NCGR_PEP_ID=MMETSP0322-20121206/1885_1 /TAXON_ID=163516 /ORGANISM="Leptocylindrus danicus var. apora, Strain B651" /LENGTH=230 /DNA_ID=CAMNT_0003535997 /DNA_START=288 /DNA_END=977 /DNA_ORIENTATION=+